MLPPPPPTHPSCHPTPFRSSQTQSPHPFHSRQQLNALSPFLTPPPPQPSRFPYYGYYRRLSPRRRLQAAVSASCCLPGCLPATPPTPLQPFSSFRFSRRGCLSRLGGGKRGGWGSSFNPSLRSSVWYGERMEMEERKKCGSGGDSVDRSSVANDLFCLSWKNWAKMCSAHLCQTNPE